MGADHARRGWALKRDRGSRSVVVATCAALVITGYAPYYLVSEASRTPISVLHWGLELALLPLLIAHIALGRRSRNAPFSGRDAHHRDIPAPHRH